MADAVSCDRPPVPSAEESSRAGLIAPLIAYLVAMSMRFLTNDPIVMVVLGVVCAAIILTGFSASIWGFYVAAFYGPQKHIMAAICGFALNATIVWLAVAAFQTARQAGADEYEARNATRDIQSVSRYYAK